MACLLWFSTSQRSKIRSWNLPQGNKNGNYRVYGCLWMRQCTLGHQFYLKKNPEHTLVELEIVLKSFWCPMSFPKALLLELQHQRNISLCGSRWHRAKELPIASVATQGRVQMCCVFTDHSVIDDGEDSKVTCQVNRHPGCLVTTRIIKAGWIVKPDAEPVHPEGGPKLEKFKSNGC